MANNEGTAFNYFTSIAESLVIGGMYICVSACLITFNKYMMMPGHFPHAVHLTAVHMTVTFLLSLSLYGIAPKLFPSMDSCKENRLTVLKYVAPLGLLFAVSLATSNLAYSYSSVAFLQFCKEGNVALMFFMSCAVGFTSFSWTKCAILSVVITGCSVCAHGEIKFVWIGLFVQLASQFAECSKNLLGEVIMSKAGLKLDVLTFVLFQAPCSLIPLMIGVYVRWSPQVWQDLVHMWPTLIANALVAFLLNILIALTLKRLSALAFVIIGLVKDIAIVLCSAVVFSDPISHTQRVGFVITLSGIFLWSRHKMQEQAEANEKKSKQNSQKAAADLESAPESQPLLNKDANRSYAAVNEPTTIVKEAKPCVQDLKMAKAA
eukprot:TRINITY_DN649_c3_g1_i2.p1 TRINITY_DN649_c3_g1~~TRINITY_DN649_c3_g1_i2.p1  ORF type:complete len:377 (+),score=56.98 TRINITY_DN649_c3_g1_i2:119-1249(+)